MISQRRFGMEVAYLVSSAGVILAQDWRMAASGLGTELLDPRFFNNVRATSCHEMASMNAWRDGDDVAIRLL
ncbi:hypothetical protein E2C01_023855 [Portunus trituberculatus]|uniref:Uncharacterized protein n=1 Tax=Portunus trituberculatus TaxID=210409 RepID=A0A5B7EAD5_PORTR|nr:hypothetical protein [Portunus trituberculatus]